MAKTARVIAKVAGGAAVESTIAALMPALFQRLDRIDQRLGELDREIHGLREHGKAQFEQLLSTINELGQRIAKVEGKIDYFMETSSQQTARMDQWVERLVKVEVSAGPKRKKAS